MEFNKQESFSEGVDSLCWVEVSWGAITAHSHPHHAPTSTPCTFSFMWSSLVVFPSFLFFQQYPSFLYFTFFLLYRIIEPFCGLKTRNRFGLHKAIKPLKVSMEQCPTDQQKAPQNSNSQDLVSNKINAPLLLLLPGWSDVWNLQTLLWGSLT